MGKVTLDCFLNTYFMIDCKNIVTEYEYTEILLDMIDEESVLNKVIGAVRQQTII